MSYQTPKFSKITKVTAKDYYATGSEKGASGFFIVFIFIFKYFTKSHFLSP